MRWNTLMELSEVGLLNIVGFFHTHLDAHHVLGARSVQENCRIIELTECPTDKGDPWALVYHD